jgi:hypothetical protein
MQITELALDPVGALAYSPAVQHDVREMAQHVGVPGISLEEEVCDEQ